MDIPYIYTIIRVGKDNIALPEVLTYGVIIGFVLMLFLLFMIKRNASNYVIVRLKEAILGGEVVEELDSNNIHKFKLGKEKDGIIYVEDRAHPIRSKSALRNPDGVLYQVHKDLGPTLNPNAIHSANNLAVYFRNIKHAIEFFRTEYFKEDWDAVKLAITNNTAQASVEINGIEKKIGLELMKPLHGDGFTQDLSVLNNWSNEDISGSQLKNTIDAVRNEAERRSGKGMDFGKMMTYVFIILALLGGITFCLVVLQGQGLLGGHAAQAASTVVTTTLP